MPDVDVFTAIASPVRRALLDALRAGPLAVHELADDFAISRPAVSQHLQVLRNAALVVEERAGRERRYRLQPGPLREVEDWLGHYERFWADHLGALRDLLDETP
ncbi:metalloregulator ArsR/SmtB family transcription factor [Polymorphospora sp. NPDC050346]|uniref:ArsR/SmtB family transcription factor n=1 Tax=Polymorphospora sp. NPDC050346 TaxID=3155780 RepID=UPI0033DCC045